MSTYKDYYEEYAFNDEPTWEQVKKYCEKRCLAIVGRECMSILPKGVVEVVEDPSNEVPSGTKVECYVRSCKNNKSGICEADDIILEFGCE